MNISEIESRIANCDKKVNAYAKGYNDGIEKARKETIDECIKAITDYCGGLPNNNLISALEQLKEKK